MDQTNIAKRLVRGISWNLAAALLGRGLGLLSTIAAARLLGKAGYGELGIIQSTVNTIGVIAGSSLGVTATKFLAQYKETDKDRAGSLMALCWATALFTGVLFTSLAFILAPWLSSTVLKAPHLAPYLRGGSFIILFSALTGGQRGMLVGFEEFKILAILTAFCGVLTLPLTIVLTYYFGLAGAIAVLIVVEFLNWVGNGYFLKKKLFQFHIRLDFFKAWANRKVLLTFSLPYAMGTLLNLPVVWICNALLVRQPGGLIEMAIFSATYRWRDFILFVPSAVSSVSAAIHAERLELQDYQSVRKVLRISLLTVSAVALGGMLLISIASSFILRQYGEGFVEQGVPVMIIALGGAVFIAMSVPFSNIVISSGRVWQGFAGGVIMGVTLLGITYYLIDLGAKGLSIAHLITGFVGLLYVVIISLPIIRKRV